MKLFVWRAQHRLILAVARSERRARELIAERQAYWLHETHEPLYAVTAMDDEEHVFMSDGGIR